MPNQFKSVVIAQLGELPPASRAERDAIYDRLRSELAAMTAPGEQAEHTAALEQAIAEVESELQGGGEAAPAAEVTTEPVVEATAEPVPDASAPAIVPLAARMPLVFAAAAIVLIAVLGAGAWYFLPAQREALVPPPTTAVPQQNANADVSKTLDPAATDKARSFQDAMRSGDAATTAFLLQSGYQPTRVELRTALLAVKYTRELQSAMQPLSPDIRAMACGFTSFADVRRPMIPPRLFDAEDAFAIMKQIGQDTWKAMCAPDAGKWRAALAKINQQSAQYNKPDAEKQKQAEACIRTLGTAEAQARWTQANCDACPESHSNCESYCPKAPKAADAEEARFFSFNRSDMQMAAMTSRKQNASRAELYCNLQYLTRATDFDLANLQRFKLLVELLGQKP